jgi:hypothetical protein
MSSIQITEIFSALDDVSPLRRSKAIEELRMSVKENHGHLLFGNVKKVFSVLNARLRDNNWNVAHQSIQFLSDLFRNQDLGPDCKSYLSSILPTLVENLGDSKVVIRKASLQVLKELLTHSDSVGQVVSTFLRCGLENDDWRVRQESVQSLHTLLGPTIHESVDMQQVLGALVSRLRDASMVVVQAAQESIFAVRALMGEEALNTAVKRMGPQKQQLFAEHREHIMKNLMGLAITPASDTLLQYGFIPINLLNQLRDSRNWKARASGIEELQRLVTSLTNIGAVVPHLPSFMELCAGLLSDQNFKISLTTLQILGAVVEKFGANMEGSLSNIMPSLISKLGDNKVVVRQTIMKCMRAAIASVKLDPVVATLLAHTDDKNGRVREEVLNIVTVALLTATDHPFDYKLFAAPLCRGLYDPKAKVREAALDCLSVIHNRIGLTEMNAIVTPSHVDEDVYRKLQNRFAQNCLPKISAEGFVLHVSQSRRGLTVECPTGADDAGSRRTTPATTPTSKIPWDLPSSRNESRQASGGAGGTGTRQPTHGEWEQAAMPEWYAAPAPANGSSAGHMGYFDAHAGSDYRVVRPTDEPGDALDWWGRGDASALDNLSEPPSPTRSAGSPLASPGGPGAYSVRRFDSPSGRYGSPTAMSSSPVEGAHESGVMHSPRRFTGGGAAHSDTTVQPTALVFDVESDRRVSRSEVEQEKVKLWLPDAVAQENLQHDPAPSERTPTGAAYKDKSGPLESWWEKAERLPAHRAGRRGNGAAASPAHSAHSSGSPASSRRSPAYRFHSSDRADSGARSATSSRGVGSAPVSAPSSAASSHRGDDAKLSILKQNGGQRRRNTSGGSSAGVAFCGDVRVGHAGLGELGGRTSSRPTSESEGSPGKSAVDLGSRPMDIIATEDLQPFSSPAREMRLCAQDLKSDDWAVQFKGLNAVRRLAAHHSEILSSGLVELSKEILGLSQNLRSSVSRNALLTFHDLFLFMKKQMDPTLDGVVPVLMKRAVETNAFICETADSALSNMVQNVGAKSAMVTLLRAAKSKQAHFRAKAALHLWNLVDVAGTKLLQFRETDELLTTFATLASDGNPDARANGKRGICSYATLYGDSAAGVSEFEKACRRILPDPAHRKALEVAAHGRTQGLDAFGSTSTGRWRGGAGTRGGKTSRSHSSKGGDGSLHLSVHGAGSGDQTASTRKRSTESRARAVKDIPQLQGLPDLFASMAGSDWRARHESVAQLVELVLQFPQEFKRTGSSILMTVFDHLTLRLADGNSKVLLLALQSVARLIPVLQNALEGVLTALIPALSQQIGSSNASIRQTTLEVLESLVQNVDSTSLVQHFANVVAFGTRNSRAKAAMVGLTAGIVESASTRSIVNHVLPRAILLLDDKGSEVRVALATLLQSLHRCLGDRMFGGGCSDEQRRRIMDILSKSLQNRHAQRAGGRLQ